MSNKLGRNDTCWCGSGKKYKKCHEQLEQRIAEYERNGCEVPGREMLKSEAEIEKIRESCKLNIAILDYLAPYVKEGAVTAELDRLLYEKTLALGGIPAPLNYNGFTKSVCISVNDVVCHGIPSEELVLQNGDIVNVDVSTVYHGYFSDSSRMFCVGAVSEGKRRLVEVAQECMNLGIEQVKPWGYLGDIGQAINDHAVKNGYSVVREIGGHGVGLKFHEDPWVGYVSQKGTGMLLVPGMLFTVEPMINVGAPDIAEDEADGWTIYTVDGEPSAQWEKMVLVTETGCEVLAY